MFNKGIIKSFVSGLIISSLLFGALNAAPLKKKIDVFYNDVKIVIDGIQLTPKDTNGNIIEPIIYNGTTYLPVRAIAEAIGKEVNWNSQQNTVFVGKEQRLSGRVVSLSELKPYTSTRGTSGSKYVWEDGESLKMYNKEYDWHNAIITDGYGYDTVGSITYLIDGKYSDISGVLGVDDSTKNTGNQWSDDYPKCDVYFEIYGDGQRLFKVKAPMYGDEPIDIDKVSLLSVNKLELRFTQDGEPNNRVRFDFADVKFTEIVE